MCDEGSRRVLTAKGAQKIDGVALGVGGEALSQRRNERARINLGQGRSELSTHPRAFVLDEAHQSRHRACGGKTRCPNPSHGSSSRLIVFAGQTLKLLDGPGGDEGVDEGAAARGQARDGSDERPGRFETRDLAHEPKEALLFFADVGPRRQNRDEGRAGIRQPGRRRALPQDEGRRTSGGIRARMALEGQLAKGGQSLLACEGGQAGLGLQAVLGEIAVAVWEPKALPYKRAGLRLDRGSDLEQSLRELIVVAPPKGRAPDGDAELESIALRSSSLGITSAGEEVSRLQLRDEGTHRRFVDVDRSPGGERRRKRGPAEFVDVARASGLGATPAQNAAGQIAGKDLVELTQRFKTFGLRRPPVAPTRTVAAEVLSGKLFGLLEAKRAHRAVVSIDHAACGTRR